jgi:hypothetical protein
MADLAGAAADLVRRVAMAARAAAALLQWVGLVGVAAATTLGLALAPWMLHAAWSVATLVVLCAAAFAGPARLWWHARLLRTRLGDEEWVTGRVVSLYRDSTALAGRLLPDAPPAGQRRRLSIRHAVRVVRSLLDASGLADQATELYRPVSPGAGVLSGLAAAEVVVVAVIACLAVVASAIGLALR